MTSKKVSLIPISHHYRAIYLKIKCMNFVKIVPMAIKLPWHLQESHRHIIFICMTIYVYDRVSRPFASDFYARFQFHRSISIWQMNDNSRCTVNNIKSHCIYFTWKFFFNSAVLDYNFHFMFNLSNSVS